MRGEGQDGRKQVLGVDGERESAETANSTETVASALKARVALVLGGVCAAELEGGQQGAPGGACREGILSR